MRKALGVDCWRLACGSDTLFARAQRYGLELYEVRLQETQVTVCTPLVQRRLFLQAFPKAQLQHTSGFTGFALRNLRRPSRLFSLLVVLLVWWSLSQFVFIVEIRGDVSTNEKLIFETLTEQYGSLPIYGFSQEEAQELLSEKLFDALTWTEVERTGSAVSVRFASRGEYSSETLHDEDLIAQRDGVIAGFDLTHGNKCVNLNDVVKKGDVLVSSQMMDSMNKEKHLLVEGRVFAYTWETIEVSCKKDGLFMPFQFFRLLLSAREQVSADFLKDDRIERENILQFEENAGTIKMTIHYTVYRDISSPV